MINNLSLLLHNLNYKTFFVFLLNIFILTSNVSYSQVARQKVNVSSDGAIEWHREEKYFLATDNAKITIIDEFGRTITLQADKIKVDHNNKAFEKVEYITATGGSNLQFENLEIFGETMFIDFADNSLVVSDKVKDGTLKNSAESRLAKLLIKSDNKAKEVKATAKKIKVYFSSISTKEFKEMILDDAVKLTTTDLEVRGLKGKVIDNRSGADRSSFLLTICEQVEISMTEVLALTDCVNYNTNSQKLELSGRSRILQQ